MGTRIIGSYTGQAPAPWINTNPALKYYPVAVLTTHRRLRYIKLWNTETRLYSHARRAWIAIGGPCDKAVRKPIDQKPRLPWSIQYPPGMKPKDSVAHYFNDEAYKAACDAGMAGPF